MTQINFTWWAAAFICGLGGGLAGSRLTAAPIRAEVPPVVITSELRLTDDTGRTRLLLTLMRGKPRLFMLDEAGEYRLEMGLGETGEPHIWLRDQDGAAKVQVVLTPKGLPAFRLADHQGQERATIGLSDSGHPTMILRDENGRDRLALWRDARDSGLALASRQGHPVAALSASEDDHPRLIFFDAQGRASLTVE